MDTVVLLLRLILAAVFVVAAVGKFIDLRSSRESLVGFGIPERPAAFLGTVLPFAELAVAVALVPRPSAQWGAAGALTLLIAFVAGISNALRKGEAPPCNCFGAIHSAPASKTTLARNILLGAGAAVALGAGPGPSVGGWVDGHSGSKDVAIGVAIAAVALLALIVPLYLENRRLKAELADKEARISRIPHGLRIGSLAPEFSVPDVDGGRMTLSSLLERGKPVILVFAIAGCGPCEPMIPTLRRLQAIAGDRLTVALLGLHTVEHYDRLREAHGGDLRLIEAVAKDPTLDAELEEMREIAHLYDIHDSPGAVLVTAAGTIGSTVVAGRPAVEALIRLTLEGTFAPPRAATAGVVA